LLTYWDDVRIIHRGPSIYASYQVSVHLASGFIKEDYSQLFLIDRFLKIFSCETAETNEPKLHRTHLWKVLYTDFSFSPDPVTNMAAFGYSVSEEKII
jgi:hypothetical protein